MQIPFHELSSLEQHTQKTLQYFIRTVQDFILLRQIKQEHKREAIFLIGPEQYITNCTEKQHGN